MYFLEIFSNTSKIKFGFTLTSTVKIALELGDRVEESNMHVRESRQLLPPDNYYQILGKFDNMQGNTTSAEAFEHYSTDDCTGAGR